jgi:hypothetical protein
MLTRISARKAAQPDAEQPKKKRRWNRPEEFTLALVKALPDLLISYKGETVLQSLTTCLGIFVSDLWMNYVFPCVWKDAILIQSVVCSCCSDSYSTYQAERLQRCPIESVRSFSPVDRCHCFVELQLCHYISGKEEHARSGEACCS